MDTVRRHRSGFTLIEVLLVLVILVILAASAVTAYGPLQRRAYINAAKNQIGLFRTALGAYQLAIGNYPTSEQGLQALITQPADLPNPALWEGPYIEGGLPLDPWGREYRYAYPGVNNPHSYDLWSAGPDGQDGTADDIGNW
jgi:general secretion pathway protein G